MAQTMMKSTTRGPLGYLGRLGGRGLAMAARPGGANQVADYEKQYAGLDKNRLLEELRADPLGHNKNSRAAILGLLSKQKGGLESLTSQEIDEVKKNKDTYEKIGAKSTSDAVLDATGTNAQVALEKIAALTEKLGAATEEEKGLLNTELSELRGTLQKSIGKMSPEILAGFFKKTDSDKNKNPLGMEGGEGGEFETFKASLAREMVGPQGATVSKFSSFISQLQEQGGGAEENFKNASKEVGSEDISEGIKKWLSNTGAANLGVSLESYYPGAASGKTAAGIKEQDEALKGVMSNTPDNEAAYEEAQKVRRENASKSKGLT